jgi:hypothetical protein
VLGQPALLKESVPKQSTLIPNQNYSTERNEPQSVEIINKQLYAAIAGSKKRLLNELSTIVDEKMYWHVSWKNAPE